MLLDGENPDADRCQHIFTYSLVPHEGDYRSAGLVQMAYDLNAPMQAIPVSAQTGFLPQQYALVTLSSDNVILETVKKAEDSEGLVFRMYDAYNRQTRVDVTFGFAPKRVTLCDLMENELETLDVRNNSVTLNINPYEIITIKTE